MIFAVQCTNYKTKSTRPMHELQNLEMSVLVDMLAQHTSEYLKMLTEGATEEEFTTCKITITLLQSEIETRKQTAANTTATDTNINFTSDTTE